MRGAPDLGSSDGRGRGACIGRRSSRHLSYPIRRALEGYTSDTYYMVSRGNGKNVIKHSDDILWCGEVAGWLYEVLQEYGIEPYTVIERGTGEQCPICHVEHEDAKICRGLYVYMKIEEKLNTGLNVASNIANRVDYKVEFNNIESYGTTHRSIITVTFIRRWAALDSAVKIRP